LFYEAAFPSVDADMKTVKGSEALSEEGVRFKLLLLCRDKKVAKFAKGFGSASAD